jgi:DNA polymerase I
MLEVMAGAASIAELEDKKEEIRNIFRRTVTCLPSADPKAMVINRRISRLSYTHRCIEGAAVHAYRKYGVEISPGMKIRYIVTDARRYQAEPEWNAAAFDLPYYRNLLEKAWKEIAFAFRTSPREKNAQKQELCEAW